MNLQDFNAAAGGNVGSATVLALYNDEFYDVSSVAVPVADCVVLVLSPEASSHPAVSAMQSTPDLVSSLQGSGTPATDTGLSGDASSEPAPKDTTGTGESGTGSTGTSAPSSQT